MASILGDGKEGILNRFYKNGPQEVFSRTIICDTETTGLENKDDRMIEFGAIELINLKETGHEMHLYFDPEGKIINPKATEVHGVTNAMLKEKKAPFFKDCYKEICNFLRDSLFVAHNALFDFGFLREELARVDINIDSLNITVVDTVPMAKMLFPGKRANLDAVSRQLGVSLASRTLHGALIDSKILKEVYIKMLDMGYDFRNLKREAINNTFIPSFNAKPDRGLGRPSDAEILMHKQFMEKNKLSGF